MPITSPICKAVFSSYGHGLLVDSGIKFMQSLHLKKLKENVRLTICNEYGCGELLFFYYSERNEYLLCRTGKQLVGMLASHTKMAGSSPSSSASEPSSC